MLMLLYSEKNTAFSSIPTKRIIMKKWRLQCNSIKPKSSRFFFFFKCLRCRIILGSYVHVNSDRSRVLKHNPRVARTNPTQCTVCIKYNDTQDSLEKDVFFIVLSRAWNKEKNSEYPRGIESQTFRFRAPMLYHWATETPRWARSITKFIWHASWQFTNKTVYSPRAITPPIQNWKENHEKVKIIVLEEEKHAYSKAQV